MSQQTERSWTADGVFKRRKIAAIKGAGLQKCGLRTGGLLPTTASESHRKPSHSEKKRLASARLGEHITNVWSFFQTLGILLLLAGWLPFNADLSRQARAHRHGPQLTGARAVDAVLSTEPASLQRFLESRERSLRCWSVRLSDSHTPRHQSTVWNSLARGEHTSSSSLLPVLLKSWQFVFRTATTPRAPA